MISISNIILNPIFIIIIMLQNHYSCATLSFVKNVDAKFLIEIIADFNDEKLGTKFQIHSMQYQLRAQKV